MTFLKLSSKSLTGLETFINGLHKVFVDCDATMLEINPAGVDTKGNIIALDAKLSIDDNALYRHKDFLPLQDEYETEERELKANKTAFNIVHLTVLLAVLLTVTALLLAAMDLIRGER